MGLKPAQISNAFVDACRLEVRALKPGNVHIYAAGHGMQVADFEKSAEVAAPHIANPDLRVGERIRRAVDATFDAVGCNTNLGIVLLCAPLAVAAALPALNGQTLHARLKRVLRALTSDDTRDVFATIARATPGGLGDATEGDVRNTPAPGLKLVQAMKLAADRDLIAKEYAFGFDRIFDLVSRYFEPMLDVGFSPEDALAWTYMKRLGLDCDTHIARKFGLEKAVEVRDRAAKLDRQIFTPWLKPSDPGAHRALLAFDAELKAEGLNPGSLADLMAAVAFTHNLKAASSS